MAIFGSHNSMTYLPPKLWIMRLFSFIWRCQKNDIKRQYANGARCFDLRIRNIDGIWYCAHGKATLKKNDIINILNYLNSQASMNDEIIYIRLLLEINKIDYKQEEKFIDFCHEVQNRYFGRLIFFEARRKFDWVKLYDFDNYPPSVIQLVGSMQSFYGKIFPWLYWKLNNKKNRKKLQNYSDDTIVLYDFV